jgi:hypothetical protein
LVGVCNFGVFEYRGFHGCKTITLIFLKHKSHRRKSKRHRR